MGLCRDPGMAAVEAVSCFAFSRVLRFAVFEALAPWPLGVSGGSAVCCYTTPCGWLMGQEPLRQVRNGVKRLAWMIVVLLLAACDGTILPAPDGGTPVAPIVSGLTNLPEYVHPDGLFRLALPASWSAGDLGDGSAALVTFGPSGSTPLLTVYAVNTGAALDEAAFQGAMEAYLAADYNAGLTVRDTSAMGDGSWRAAGVRQRGGVATPVNVFMQRDGAIFSALETAVPAGDAVQMALLTHIINSYRVDPAAAWPVGLAGQVPAVPPELILVAGNLTFSGLLTWQAPDGAWVVSGRVANRAPYALEQVTIRAALQDSLGQTLIESGGGVPVAVLPDGEYAPFTLRFDSGRPAAAFRLALAAEGRQATDALATYYGPEHFDWEDRAEYDSEGRLHILGTVWNVGDARALDVQALVTVFDPADRVAGTVAQPAAATLDPGQSARFDAPVPVLGGDPAHYLVVMMARR